MVLCTVAISDTLGLYLVICGSFWYVDVPVVLYPMEMVDLVSGSFESLDGVRYCPHHFSNSSLCLLLLFALIFSSCLFLHCLMNLPPVILVLAMSLAEFIVSVSFPAVMKSEYVVPLVNVLQPGFTPLSCMNLIILLIFSTCVLCSLDKSHVSDRSVIAACMISTSSV